MTSLRRYFTPPVFEDDEQTRVARLLYWILLIVAGLNILDMLLLLIFAPETLPTFWVNGLGLFITFASFWMVKRGWVTAASLMLCVPLWGLIAYYLAISGGVTSPAFGFLAPVIIVGAVLLGTRGAILFGLLVIATGGILVVLGNNGMLILVEAPPTPSRIFATQTAIFVSLMVMLALNGRNVYDALNRARHGEKTLAERNRQLQQEIIERERAQAEQARLAAIVENTSDFVGIADVEGNTLYLNRSARKLMGFAEGDDIASLKIPNYHPPTIIDLIIKEAIPTAARQGTWSGETVVLTRDGREIPVSQVVIASRSSDGKVEFLSTIIRDLSEHKQAERANLELALQRERIELFKEFLGNISHDLKTPLTVINTSLYLLKRSTDPLTQQEKIKNIEQQAELLEQYIQDLLLLSRLDHAPELSLAPLDLNRVLNDIRSRLAPAFENKKLTLHLELDTALPPVLADEKELYRALTNLVENAVNYTPDGGSVTLRTSQDEGQVLTQVSDTGIGIPSQELPHIFDRFYRAEDARKLRAKGTGLGLAIVKRIIEIHSGTIEVESTQGSGTAFSIYLPVYRSA